MKNHRSLARNIMLVSGLAHGAHCAPSVTIGRRRATRGFLAVGLTLGSAGTAFLALPGHVSAGPGQAAAHQPVNTAAHHLALSKTTPKAWMY